MHGSPSAEHPPVLVSSSPSDGTTSPPSALSPGEAGHTVSTVTRELGQRS